MKILHVEGGRHLYGGAQQVLYLLRGLHALGHDSHLACPRGCALAAAAAPFAGVHELTMRGDADVLIVPRLARLIRRLRPDIVHLHSRIGADVMGGFAARLAGVPAVHTRRVDNPEPHWQARLKYPLFERVVAISEGIAAVLRAAGVAPTRLRVVRSAVDVESYARPCERVRAGALLETPPDAVLIGVIAQLIARKGHRVLLDALPPLLARHPQVRVLLFGQGPLEGELRQRIAASEFDGRVRLMGFRDDLAVLLPCLDLVVHPALMEGLGVSLLQAASAGVPILASAVGGIPEAVRDGENGVLVPPGDSAALGAALGQLLDDAPLRRRLGANGQRLMREAFSCETMVAGNLAVYREVLRSCGGRAA